MRWFWYRRVLVFFAVIGSVLAIKIYSDQYSENEQQASTKNIDSTMVIPGGMPIGIYMKIDGVLVLSTDEIEDCNGVNQEPAKKIIKSGDYIVAINDSKVESKNDLIQEISKLSNPQVILNIRRNGESFDVKFDAIQVAKNQYKLGIWVRDSLQGLGTITYLTATSEFGALGHGIHDIDTESLVEIESGNVYDISIVGVQKGKKGNPGGLEGVIIYNNRNILGTITKNTKNGIYGEIDDIDDLFKGQEAVEVCDKKEIKLGDAEIYCAVDGEIKAYDIEIKSIDYYTKEENKGLVIEVVDEELIEKTGGIVQGMSGSPIIQDGKLVGAVTHVLVNDPTRGYGIFIENMLEAAG